MDKYINGIKRFINKNINKQNTKDFLLNHKNTLIVIVAIILLGGITTIISYAYFTIIANQSIVGGQVGTITNINMYYFVEDKNASTGAGLGTYSKSVYVPRTTYTYNSSLSYCKHGSTLSYNATTYTFTVSNTKDACYAYFDVSESKNADIVLNIYMQKNGEYKLVNEVPSGYYIDTTQSSCTNGATMTLDNGEITVNTTDKTVCSAYFNGPKYWNNNFPDRGGFTYPDLPIPTRIYNSLAELKSNYIYFSTSPFYIKTTDKHEVCFYYNNREFCAEKDYWEGTIDVESSSAGLATLNKLKPAIESALGTTASSCSYSSTEASCVFGNVTYRASYNGDVRCSIPSPGRICEVSTLHYADCVLY